MTRKNSTTLVVVLLLLILGGAYWPQVHETETPGAFCRGDILISQGQTVSKLLVVNGNATIEGRVLTWLAVIGGNLVVRDGGEVNGAAVILNGQAAMSPNAGASPTYLLVLPPGSPLIGLLLWTIVLGTIFLGIFAALTGWLLAGWFKRTNAYTWLYQYIRKYHHRWPGMLALVGLGASCLLLTVFVHFAEETIYYHEADLIDNLVIWLVRYFASPLLDKIMLVITYLGSGYAYALLAPLALAVLARKRRWHEAATLAGCLAGAALLNFLLKHLFERARPDLFKVISETGYSFPSGHAMVSVCFYGILSYILGRGILNVRVRLALYAIIVILVAAIGISRIYLGVHYPSDVLAGYFAGGTWLAFCAAILWWWEIEK